MKFSLLVESNNLDNQLPRNETYCRGRYAKVRVDDGILFKVKQVLPPQKVLPEIVDSVDVQKVDLDDDESSNGFRPFPNRGGVVIDELIDELRNQVRG